MTYKPVIRPNKSRQKMLADKEARAIYEAMKLQIDLSIKLKELSRKCKINRK